MTSKEKWVTFIFFIVIIFSFFLRLWKNQELFFWHIDEDIIGLTVKRILVDHRPQLTGFPVPGGIYLGPLVFYLLAIPYGLLRMDPSGLPYISAILSTFTVFLVYFVGKTIFKSKSTGLIAATIYGSSFLVNIYARIYSGLALVGILSLLTYFFLFKLISEKGGRNFFYLSLVLLVAVQNEGSSFSLLALTFVTWCLYKFKIEKAQLKVALIVFLIFHIPLLLFNFRHNFVGVTSFVNFLSKALFHNGNGDFNFAFFDTLNLFPKTLSRIFYLSGPNNVAEQILPCSDLVAARDYQNFFVYLIALFALGVFAVSYILRKKRASGETILFTHFIVLTFGLVMYNMFMKGYLYEWTLLIFFPGFSLIVANLLQLIYKRGLLAKAIVVLLLTLFVLMNTMLILTSKNSFGLKSKVNAVRRAANELGDKSFTLDSIGSCYAQGYLYLFWYFKKEQVSSYADEWFGTSILAPKTDIKADLKVVMVNPSKNESKDFFDKYLFYRNEAFKSIDTGEVEILFLNQARN